MSFVSATQTWITGNHSLQKNKDILLLVNTSGQNKLSFYISSILLDNSIIIRTFMGEVGESTKIICAKENRLKRYTRNVDEIILPTPSINFPVLAPPLQDAETLLFSGNKMLSFRMFVKIRELQVHCATYSHCSGSAHVSCGPKLHGCIMAYLYCSFYFYCSLFSRKINDELQQLF